MAPELPSTLDQKILEHFPGLVVELKEIWAG